MNLGTVCMTHSTDDIYCPQEEFRDVHPHDIIPVEINDAVFAIHAVVLTSVYAFQALIYEVGNSAQVSAPSPQSLSSSLALAIVRV